MNAYRIIAECAECSSIALARGLLMCIENGRGRQLQVEQGSVWVTQSGSIKDVSLNAGESFRIERDGLTLVTSYGRALTLLKLGRPALVTPTLLERLRNFCASMYAPAPREASAAR